MKIGPSHPCSPATGGAKPASPAQGVQGLSPEKDAKLRKAAQQMEGTFVQQMYKAMRETVPTDGGFTGGSGEEMFTGLLDEKVATDTPTQWQEHGLSSAIYRQMRAAALQHEPKTPAPK